MTEPEDKLGDLPTHVGMSPPERIARGYFAFDRVRFVAPNGAEKTHDVLRGGRAVAVLPVDLQRQEVVLIRQFRPIAQLANGHGSLIEVVAGRVDEGEDPPDAARRECEEEIGVAPDSLVEIFDFLTSPGLTDELITLYLAGVDASRVRDHAGLAAEGEETRTYRVAIGEIEALVSRGVIHNGPCLLGLQWLALNRHRLAGMLERGVIPRD